MNKSIACTLTFGIGVAVGVFAAKEYFKKDYENRIHEYEKDIESVRNMYNDKLSELNKKKTEEAKAIADKNKQKPDLESLARYHELIGERGYKDYNGISKEPKENVKSKVSFDDISIITPDEAGEEYELQAVTCYADGVVTDCYDEIMDNPEEIIGTEYEEHFGEYANDTVFVRNERLKCDYEISKDNRNYEDVEGEEAYDN